MRTLRVEHRQRYGGRIRFIDIAEIYRAKVLIFFLIWHEIKKLIEKTGCFLIRAPVRIPVVIVLRVILATVLRPYGIHRGLERWLINEGAENARLEDVDLNSIIGQLAVRNIQVTVEPPQT